MSKTQQEIAAPKACKKFLSHIYLTATAATATALAAFLVFAYRTDLFSQHKAAAIVITVIIGVLFAFSAVGCIAYKAAKNLAAFGFYAVMTAIVLAYLVLIEPIDYYLTESFTVSMLLILGATLVFICFTVLYSILCFQNRGKLIKNRGYNSILAALYGCLFAIAVLFGYYLRGKKDYASYIWGIAGFAVTAQVLMCIITALLDGKKKVITTKWITYCATFSALSVVCKIMGNAVSFIPALKFSPVYVPWVTAGLVLGPVGGMIAAGVGDVLGQLIMPSGFANINPMITAANMLFAMFPAIMYRYSPIKKDWLNILIGMIISTVFCTLGLSTFAQWLFYYRDTKYTAYLATKFFQPIVIGINYFLIIMLLPALKRARITNLRFHKASAHA